MATTKLKLHREIPALTTSPSPSRADDIPASFRFPTIPEAKRELGRSQRQTLLAGRIEPDETSGDQRHLRPPPLSLTSEDGTVRTPQLVQQVELTLEAMQARVNRLRAGIDNAYKFPSPPSDDDHRPTAA